MSLILILPIEKLLHTLRISCLVSRASCSEDNSQELCPHYFPLTVASGDMPYVLTVLWIVRPRSLSLTKHGLEPQVSFKVGSLMELPWPGIFRGFPSDNAAFWLLIALHGLFGYPCWEIRTGRNTSKFSKAHLLEGNSFIWGGTFVPKWEKLRKQCIGLKS